MRGIEPLTPTLPAAGSAAQPVALTPPSPKPHSAPFPHLPTASAIGCALPIPLIRQWAVQGSNLRPTACKAAALPAELTAPGRNDAQSTRPAQPGARRAGARQRPALAALQQPAQQGRHGRGGFRGEQGFHCGEAQQTGRRQGRPRTGSIGIAQHARLRPRQCLLSGQDQVETWGWVGRCPPGTRRTGGGSIGLPTVTGPF